MPSDQHFTLWFEAYKRFDKDIRSKLFKEPFIQEGESGFTALSVTDSTEDLTHFLYALYTRLLLPWKADSL